MIKFLPLLVLLSVFKYGTAQDEQLFNLKFNPALYYPAAKKMPPKNHLKYLVNQEGTTIITTDTLILPFIDDFSTNREPGYKWLQNHVTDSFSNVLGGCLLNEGIYTVTGNFISTPGWSYSYDFVNHVVDSFPLQPVTFTYFGSSPFGC